jgi:hypothetical protein
MLASPSSEATALEYFPRLLLFSRWKKEDPVVVTTSKEEFNRTRARMLWRQLSKARCL